MKYTTEQGKEIELSLYDMREIFEAYLVETCRTAVNEDLGNISEKPEQYTQKAKDELVDRVMDDMWNQIFGDDLTNALNDRIYEMDSEVDSPEYADNQELDKAVADADEITSSQEVGEEEPSRDEPEL